MLVRKAVQELPALTPAEDLLVQSILEALAARERIRYAAHSLPRGAPQEAAGAKKIVQRLLADLESDLLGPVGSVVEAFLIGGDGALQSSGPHAQAVLDVAGEVLRHLVHRGPRILETGRGAEPGCTAQLLKAAVAPEGDLIVLGTLRDLEQLHKLKLGKRRVGLLLVLLPVGMLPLVAPAVVARLLIGHAQKTNLLLLRQN
mmetsp:Transcript_44996/g.95989  ORF Transcript_44996/g.95989 Transcript_44996/m.95989 type:complete len:202 (-) Transcript_44996:2320-2925(-)